MESVNCLLIPINDLVNNQPTAVNALIGNHNVSLIVIKNSSQYSVFLNQCPHQGRRLDYAPGQFLSKSGAIICAAHGATFELAGGLCVQGPCRGESLIAVASRLIDDQLQVDLTQIIDIKTSD